MCELIFTIRRIWMSQTRDVYPCLSYRRCCVNLANCVCCTSMETTLVTCLRWIIWPSCPFYTPSLSMEMSLRAIRTTGNFPPLPPPPNQYNVFPTWTERQFLFFCSITSKGKSIAIQYEPSSDKHFSFSPFRNWYCEPTLHNTQPHYYTTIYRRRVRCRPSTKIVSQAHHFEFTRHWPEVVQCSPGFGFPSTLNVHRCMCANIQAASRHVGAHSDTTGACRLGSYCILIRSAQWSHSSTGTSIKKWK